ncbi:flagellar motor protein MotB [Phenylobacterium kunshanense]|uniref:Chemotaxis protein MotB n=1 Tax=Phenylobacterium kunshanense TaxID=1445034 RepID=A0A328BNK0_9CAUL|nr:flagellar motor protein MotB [Phenylobacterium kunshanense]RAK68673.1 chemotaxis protein MotB [Phenylobacterium kunshanense]
MAVGEQPIIIKKIKKGGGGGHHGGAWKVAYADFVTAMMAFFLLMWLINTTSPEQKRGIADYFAPASVSQTSSGAGGILAGTALGNDGAKASGSSDVIEELAPSSRNPNDGESADGAKPMTPEQAAAAAEDQAAARREAAAFASAAQSLRQALQDMPELAELSKNIIIDETPEGLRIQLVDQEGRSMFNQGASQPNERAKLLLRAISKIINQLPNRISIYGHTSASAGGVKPETDWALSAARADNSRKVLAGAGVDRDRVYQVSGKAASEPLYPDDPMLPGNRRIAIVLLREAPVLPADPGL